MKTLTLSGWTQAHDAVVNALAPQALSFDYSAYAGVDESFFALNKYSDAEHVIGWSMGGQLAVRAIMAGVLRPRQLTLIGVPYQFVQSPAMRTAMDMQTFTIFRENYARDPVRTASRFHALVAKGDRASKQVMARLSHHDQVTDTGRWLPWLDALGQFSLHQQSVPQVASVLIVHGAADTIVPVAQVPHLAKKFPGAQVDIWDGVAHAPHAHDAARLRASMQQHGHAA